MSNEQPIPESNETKTGEAQAAAETQLPVKRFRGKQIAIVAAAKIEKLSVRRLVIILSLLIKFLVSS